MSMPDWGARSRLSVRRARVHRARRIYLSALIAGLSVLLAGAPLSLARAPAPDTARGVTGLWDATVKIGALEVPFKFGIEAGVANATGWFFNGKEHVSATDGSFDGRHLVLNFASYAKRLDATLTADGTLEGVYAPTTPGSTVQPYPFHAHRTHNSKTATAEKVPDIAGLWIVPAQSEKAGENAWRLIISQTSVQITAAILRVDGDTGALTGTWSNDKVLLSHFDG